MRPLNLLGLPFALLLPVLAASQSFRLDFELEHNGLCGVDTGMRQFRVYCTLSGSFGGMGAKGWTLGVRSASHRILSATVEGTDAAAALVEGFSLTEVTHGAGNEGAMSLVELSLGEKRSLEPDLAHRLLALDVEARLGETLTLEYVDGLRGRGGEVANVVLTERASVQPGVRSREIRVADESYLGFALENLASPSSFERVIGGSSLAGSAVVNAAPGDVAETHVFGCIVPFIGTNEFPFDGIWGWTLSLPVEGDVELVSAETRGTAMQAYLRGGFEATQIVDPADNNGRRGVVSGVILAFGQPASLPHTGTYSVLDVTLQEDAGACEGGCTGVLSFEDGLRPRRSPPAENGVTIFGNYTKPCGEGLARLDLRFLHVPRPFQRGNLNGDARVNLSDAIFILDGLFLSGFPASCAEAEDINDDGRITLSDPIYLFGHLFLGTAPPPAPFPECGQARVDDLKNLGCDRSPVACE